MEYVDDRKNSLAAGVRVYIARFNGFRPSYEESEYKRLWKYMAILKKMLKFSLVPSQHWKQVDPGVECSLYVDDFVIMYKSPTIDAIQR